MDYHQLAAELKSKFPNLTIESDHPLAPYTTLKIGGPADIFIHVKQNQEFIQVLEYLASLNNDVNSFSKRSEHEPAYTDPEGSGHRKNSFASGVPTTILGNGSNVLISDQGLRGIVIKNSSNSIEIINTNPIKVDFHHSYTQRKEDEPDKYLDFTKLDYDESDQPQVLVKTASGTPLPLLITSLLNQSITGLQWFAYIPGTIGGAVWYNIHGGNYHISDYLESVEVFDMSTSQVRSIDSKSLDWTYEKSYFQLHPELIITSLTLRLFRGDAQMATKVRDAWIAQKVKVQPMNSAGSAFANPALETCQKIWGEQKSTGWIIDHELGLKGTKIGGAQISEKHANFIVNQDHATAVDYKALLDLISSQVKQKFGFDLVPEVRLLGEF